MDFKMKWTLFIVIGIGFNIERSGIGSSLGLGFYPDGPSHPPSRHTSAVGGHVIFDCELDFPQNIKIPYMLQWNKDAKNIFSWYQGNQLSSPEYADRIIPLNNVKGKYGEGSINLTAIRETDMGWYECKVMFPNRTPMSRNNGTWFRLDIEGENLIAIPPVNETTLEGEEAHFQCVTKQADSFVKWYKDGDAIVDLPDLVQRSWVNADGSLSIKPTSMVDFGEYMCEVVNATGFNQTAKAYLDVQYKAKVIYTPREIYLPYGRPSVLDCHFRANPPLINLFWEKDGFLFDPYNVRGVFFRGNGSLYFDKVDESHAGAYSCTPHNALGTEGPSPKIKVIVQRPPVFTATPNSIYIKKVGDSIEIPCDALDGDGQLKPTIIWTKRDGSTLPEGRYSQEGGNITIENLQEEDRGLYQCSATNEAATVTTETELMIENVPPRAPYNLVATSTTNSVTLRWAPASSMQTFTNPTEWGTYTRPDMEYSVWYKLVDSSEWRKMPVASSRVTEATISNLYPGREYEFMVLSQDKFSDGMFSKSIRSRTKDGSDEITGTSRETLETAIELGPPRDISVHLTADGYLVSWSPPNHGLDALRVYVVRIFQGPQKHLVASVETTKTYYLVYDLDEDEIYHFAVAALSVNDFNTSSEMISIHVPPYGKVKAIVGSVAGVLILLLICAVIWFARHRLRNKCINKSNDGKMFNGDKQRS